MDAISLLVRWSSPSSLLSLGCDNYVIFFKYVIFFAFSLGNIRNAIISPLCSAACNLQRRNLSLRPRASGPKTWMKNVCSTSLTAARAACVSRVRWRAYPYHPELKRTHRGSGFSFFLLFVFLSHPSDTPITYCSAIDSIKLCWLPHNPIPGDTRHYHKFYSNHWVYEEAGVYDWNGVPHGTVS